MKKILAVFIRQIMLFTLILALVATILYIILPNHWFSVSLPFLFFFFLAATIISYHILINAMTHRFSRFVNVFLLVTGAKLLIYLLLIVAYVYFNRSDSLPFLIGFFILYICYTVFEVVKLVSVTKIPGINAAEK